MVPCCFQIGIFQSVATFELFGHHLELKSFRSIEKLSLFLEMGCPSQRYDVILSALDPINISQILNHYLDKVSGPRKVFGPRKGNKQDNPSD